jgi:hypothetical protein
VRERQLRPADSEIKGLHIIVRQKPIHYLSSIRNLPQRCSVWRLSVCD